MSIRSSVLGLAAIPTLASAQFVYDDSHNANAAGSGVEFAVGVSNGANQADYAFPDSSTVNGSSTLSASGAASDTNYGATHHGSGTASLMDVSNSGGISVTGTLTSIDTLDTAGGNSFFNGIAFGDFGVDVGFLATATGDFTMLASGTRSNVTAASGAYATTYFHLSLQDRSTSDYLESTTIDYRDQTGGPYNPLNTVVHLVAGDYYELNGAAFALSDVPYPDDPGSSTSVNYDFNLQLGNPAAVPELPTFLPFVGVLGLAYRRRRSRTSH